MNSNLAVIVVGILLAIVLFFLLKDIVKLIINSVLGLLILFFVNYFHIMGYLNEPDIPINVTTVLLCILAGIPGALLVIILHLMAVPGF